MKWHLALAAVLAATAPAYAAAEEDDWVFRPSYYSHSVKTGQRVVQYKAPKPALVYADPTYQESAYRHNHVAITVGGEDHLHVVQTWGRGESIRPYGEWEFPFRAGATPYGPWGNPQGPWTLPFDSWVNPYGLGKLPNPPWPYAPYGPSPAYVPPPAAAPAPAPAAPVN